MIGEDARIMVASVAEGDDKPLKYPLMFRACELVVVNKIDLLEHVDFSMDSFLYHLDAVHPGVDHLRVSARTGEGVDEVRDWLARLPDARGGAGLKQAAGHRDRTGCARCSTRGWRRTSASSPARPSASRGCATAWRSASRAAGG